MTDKYQMNDRVIVKRMAEEKTTPSGIVIPDAATEKPDQGEIVAVGNGKIGDDGKVLPMNVKVGDRVLFGKYSGQAFKLEGVEYIIMREDDIIALIVGEA